MTLGVILGRIWDSVFYMCGNNVGMTLKPFGMSLWQFGDECWMIIENVLKDLCISP